MEIFRREFSDKRPYFFPFHPRSHSNCNFDLNGANLKVLKVGTRIQIVCTRRNALLILYYGPCESRERDF